MRARLAECLCHALYVLCALSRLSSPSAHLHAPALIHDWIHREQRRQLNMKEWSIKYPFHLLCPAWGKCTVPWPFENGTPGNNQRGFVLPPPQPDGAAIGGRKGIFSNKVGCNVRAETDCWDPNSRHVRKVSLTPPDHRHRNQHDAPNNNPTSRSHCLLWCKNFK